MNHTPTSHAAQAGIDLDKLEAPAADERALFEAWSNRVAPAHGFEVDERGQYVEYPVHTGWAAWQARAALARQAASPTPAAQAVDALVHAADAVVERWHSRDWKQPHTGEFIARLAAAVGAAKRAASPTPETAQADDVARKAAYWWDTLLKCARLLDVPVEESIPQGVLGRVTALAHAQQDAAPAELHIGVSNNDQGVHINIMQRHADDSCTVLYAAKCPKGDSFGSFTVYTAPSAATGKAAAANAGGLTDAVDAAMVEMANIYPPLRRSECERLIRAALSSQSPATSAGGTSDGARAKIGSIMPCGSSVTNVYEAYAAGKRAATSAADAKDVEQWTKTPPTEQADYWNWDGDPDHAPMIYHVMWSGTAKKCFVSMGQYDIDEAIWCDNFGGWWLKIEQPSIPSGRAAIAASQKGDA